MFDLSIHTYDEVIDFLEKNIKKINAQPCIEYKLLEPIENNDLYEIIIVSIDCEYFDNPEKNFNICDVSFDKCYYYVLKYNDESYFNELSVIDCGGYYVGICIFKNKINITNQVVHNKSKCKKCPCFKLEDCECAFYFHFNTMIGNKFENIPRCID